ncbi:MAG: purine-nucleoside phosphorylase [delta proteobacterium ML8_F1]|nr:MAG: purine-nucleoside phosphorylase [delta proteobacterium ML8_F1]
MIEKILASTEFIRQKHPGVPRIGLILGSGLGDLADEIENPTVLPYNSIPSFPVSTVEGHKGQLVLGTLMGKEVIAMQGRFHYYEGYDMQTVTYPVRVMKELGVEILIVTNACGGMNPKLYPGGLMLIKDHINMMGSNPLIGENLDRYGPRFPDMSRAYDPELIALGVAVGKKLEIEVKKGVYVGISGPYYMSRAELKMLRILGGDALGMSTVPETIVANHSGLRVLGISLVTDMAVADTLEPIDHSIVMAMAEESKPRFIRYVKGILEAV